MIRLSSEARGNFEGPRNSIGLLASALEDGC